MPNARSCHCNHLYLDDNSRLSKLLAISGTLASFIQLRAVVCVSYAHYSGFEMPFSLYFTQRDEKRFADLKPSETLITKYVERWCC